MPDDRPVHESPQPSPARSGTGLSDEIYVGYLPVPRGQRVFLRWIVPAVGGLLLLGALLAARSQRSPGTGVWDTAHPTQLRGTLITHPYPMLLTAGTDGSPELVLLVERGKHGARPAAGLEAKPVIVSGSLLQRDGRRILELDAAERALAPDPAGTPRSIPQPIPMGRTTLRGEIIDPKCFLGAMKPGEGKTHKECATLCIRGGIPPMFVTRDDTGRATYYLLQGADGGPADPAMYPFIADPVEITGESSSSAGMKFLRVGVNDIERL